MTSAAAEVFFVESRKSKVEKCPPRLFSHAIMILSNLGFHPRGMYHTFGKPALPPLDFVFLLRTSAIQVKLDGTRFVVGCKEASVPPAARLSHHKQCTT